MLFLTISMIFTAFDLKESIDRSKKLFDASAFLIVDNEDPKDNDIEEYLNTINFKFGPYEKHVFYSEYNLNTTPENFLSPYVSEQEHFDLKEKIFYSDPTAAIKISDYNAILKLKGQEAINLKEDEVLVATNYEQVNNAFSNFKGSGNSISIEDKTYTIKNESLLDENVTIARYKEFFYLIIPDNFTGNLELEFTSFNVVFDEEYAEKSEEKFANLFNNLEASQYKNLSPALVIGGTWNQVQDRNNGAIALFVFLGLFLGLIFIITSAAVLALQQLSDASDSLERYKSLKKISSGVRP